MAIEHEMYKCKVVGSGEDDHTEMTVASELVSVRNYSGYWEITIVNDYCGKEEKRKRARSAYTEKPQNLRNLI